MLKAEKLLLKCFIELNYPSGTHTLNLDLTFDYYAGLCSRALRNSNNLEWKIYPLDADEEEKIACFIWDNRENEKGSEMEKYYYVLKAMINTLSKYYNIDGKKK